MALLCVGGGARHSRKPLPRAIATCAAGTLLLVVAAVLCSCGLGERTVSNATYLGVRDYADAQAADAADFEHRFLVDGEEALYAVSVDNDYALQNALMVGYAYDLVVSENEVITATRLEKGALSREERAGSAGNDNEFEPVLRGTPGKRTLKNFLATAMEPMGSVLYVYGGGWNWQDNGSDSLAASIGLSDAWIDFYESQDEDFLIDDGNDPANSYFPHGGFNQYHYAGLDCSGYLGWVLYNVEHEDDGQEGYVWPAAKIAKKLADDERGTLSKDMHELRVGDIVSQAAHVWICVGTCDDGSVVLAHSSSAESVSGSAGGGVQLSALGTDQNCEAYQLVSEYLRRYYPGWCDRYDPVLKDWIVYTDLSGDDAGRLSWHTDARGLEDPDGYADMDAAEVLGDLFRDAPLP